MKRDEVHLTNLEEKVKEYLDMKGIEHIPQYPFRTGFVCDFLLSDAQTIIEVDGERWHSSKKQKKKDRFKDYMIKREGFYVVRIKEKDILDGSFSSVVDEFG